MKILVKRLKGTWRPLVILAMIISLAGTACQTSVSALKQETPVANVNAAPGQTLPAPAITITSLPSPTLTTDFAGAVRQVAQAVRPAVVQITNQQTQPGQFNQPFSVPAGVGSGVIFDPQGHILTNNHVIADAEQLLVALPDGRTFPGKLVGADPLTDLAVIQIQDDGSLPVAQMGDSSKLQVGDWVVAIGNALALEGGPTVTAGVVSALNRAVQEPSDSPGPGGAPGAFLFDLVQTDAPINPGNSGGPLVNLDGQVIGINTLVAGQAEPGVPAQGIGFAIATTTAAKIANELVTNGKVVHPFLGISYTPLNPAIAAHLGIRQSTGALVSSVVRGSPAAAAGLQAEDVVTAIDGTPIKSDSDLARIVDNHKPGDAVTLTVSRNNQDLSIKVTLGNRTS